MGQYSLLLRTIDSIPLLNRPIQILRLRVKPRSMLLNIALCLAAVVGGFVARMHILLCVSSAAAAIGAAEKGTFLDHADAGLGGWGGGGAVVR
jgi:hypothetical protein